MSNLDLERRESTAAMVGFGLLIAVPAVVGLGMLFVTAWLVSLGDHNAHAMVWGWLSVQKRDSHGHPHWVISSHDLIYFLGVSTAYLFYQVCELLWLGFKTFRQALA